MQEWYRVRWDHVRFGGETAKLVRATLALARRDAEVRSTTYRQLYLDGAGVDPFLAGEAQLRACLDGIAIDPEGLVRDDWLDLLMTHRIQPSFAPDRITVVHDWPASQCALAKIRAGEPPVAERFELYLGPPELANGYHELTDAAEQRARFERDARVRGGRGQSQLPRHGHLQVALELGKTYCVVVALGIERLLMALAGIGRIADVLAFELVRA